VPECCHALGRREEWGVTADGFRVSLGDNKNVLELVVRVAQSFEYSLGFSKLCIFKWFNLNGMWIS
jgi:hypothetical protein